MQQLKNPIFSYNLPAGSLSSDLKLNFWLKIFCKNFILQAIFQSAQHLYEKKDGSGSVPLSNGSESGSWRPKNIRIQIRIPSTAIFIYLLFIYLGDVYLVQ